MLACMDDNDHETGIVLTDEQKRRRPVAVACVGLCSTPGPSSLLPLLDAPRSSARKQPSEEALKSSSDSPFGHCLAFPDNRASAGWQEPRVEGSNDVVETNIPVPTAVNAVSHVARYDG
jgi:hypothetical protein